MLCVIDILSGGVASIAKAINDIAAAQRQLEEAKRYYQAVEEMTLDIVLYLMPHETNNELILHNIGKQM